MRLPVYLDYMSTSPVDPRVSRKMMGCLEQNGNFGNPSSTTHSYGWQAAEAIEIARGQVASAIGATTSEIIWTSGATEANNLAVIGAARFYARQGKHIITSKTEHKSLLATCAALEKEGFEITYLKPASNGIISPDDLTKSLREDTILVSMMHVNNEIGVIQDIAAFAKITRSRGVLLHCDAAQSIGKAAIDVATMDVDLMSLSAHKAYGPKGIGALYIRRQPRVRLAPILFGGGQEQNIRPGTLPTHQIVGMGEAFAIANAELAEDQQRIAALRDRLWQGISTLEEITLHGDVKHRVANILNVGFGYVEGEALIMALQDIAVSTSSSCTSATVEPSHVLMALGVPDNLAHSSLRMSLGRFTTAEEIDYAIEVIKTGVTRLRNLSPLWEERNKC